MSSKNRLKAWKNSFSPGDRTSRAGRAGGPIPGDLGSLPGRPVPDDAGSGGGNRADRRRNAKLSRSPRPGPDAA